MQLLSRTSREWKQASWMDRPLLFLNMFEIKDNSTEVSSSWDQQHMETKSQHWSPYPTWQPVCLFNFFLVSLCLASYSVPHIFFLSVFQFSVLLFSLSRPHSKTTCMNRFVLTLRARDFRKLVASNNFFFNFEFSPGHYQNSQVVQTCYRSLPLSTKRKTPVCPKNHGALWWIWS